jgi:hypothetical protein
MTLTAGEGFCKRSISPTHSRARTHAGSAHAAAVAFLPRKQMTHVLFVAQQKK